MDFNSLAMSNVLLAVIAFTILAILALLYHNWRNTKP